MELHGRLLKGLLESCTLVGQDGEVAWLQTSNGRHVALIDGESPGVAERIARTVARTQAGEMHVVVAGGGDEAARSLRAAWPFWQLTRRFGFHRVDAEGNYEHVKGARLPLLAGVAERLPSLQPPTPEELERSPRRRRCW